MDFLYGCRVARGAPEISYLFFTDDSFFFLHANLEKSDVLKNCFQMYEVALGQKINFEKSSIFFSSNTDAILSN